MYEDRINEELIENNDSGIKEWVPLRWEGIKKGLKEKIILDSILDERNITINKERYEAFQKIKTKRGGLSVLLWIFLNIAFYTFMYPLSLISNYFQFKIAKNIIFLLVYIIFAIITGLIILNEYLKLKDKDNVIQSIWDDYWKEMDDYKDEFGHYKIENYKENHGREKSKI